MKIVLLCIAVCANILPAVADEYVNGYFRKDGTYVAPHYRTDPNNNAFDNYSTKGNVNPYTGQLGTVDPYKSYNSLGTVNNPHNRRQAY